jgi:predicted carbohydrate-binding protein with CBM5 and CBM33 domain
MPNTGPSHEKAQSDLLDTATARTDAGNDAAIVTLTSDLAAAVAVNVTQTTAIANLNAWATALATKINVLTAKLNADAGVTDVNYATDFDTDPQA